MHARIYEADARILGFCKKLGELQEALYDSLAKPYSDHPSRNLSGKVDKQKFSVHQVTVMAERLGLMSAPPDYAEREGLVLLKPPAPQEELLSASILHKPLDLIIQESENEMLTLQREISAVDATTHNIPSPEDRKMKESLLSKFSEKLDALDSDEEDIDQELSPEALASLWSQLK